MRGPDNVSIAVGRVTSGYQDSGLSFLMERAVNFTSPELRLETGVAVKRLNRESARQQCCPFKVEGNHYHV